MRTATKRSEESRGINKSILDTTVRLLSSHLRDKTQGSFHISGLDTTTTTYLICQLSSKKKTTQFFTQPTNGSEEIDGTNFYAAAAKTCIDRLLQNHRRLEDIPYDSEMYVEVHGGTSYLRELTVKLLDSRVKIPVYTEAQFPQSQGRVVIDLDNLNFQQAT